jgi:hypothetical protein
MIKLSDIQVGSRVQVRGCFGMDEPVEALVTEVFEEIKNGKPGITYGNSWAYLNQVVQVVEF